MLASEAEPSINSISFLNIMNLQSLNNSVSNVQSDVEGLCPLHGHNAYLFGWDVLSLPTVEASFLDQ